VLGDLPLDALHHPFADAMGRDQQLSVLLAMAVAGQGVEEIGDVGGDVRVAGDVADIAVGAGGIAVIVS